MRGSCGVIPKAERSEITTMIKTKIPPTTPLVLFK
jgi:hypothetical protein